MAKEHADRLNVISDIQDENRKKQLRMEDDEEDFLDESKIFLYTFQWIIEISQ